MRLYGRDSEQRVLDALVRAAADGRGGALALRGEPGAGKTALLDHAAGLGGGGPVLRHTCTPARARLPYSGLGLLLRPLLPLAERLPARRREALRTALALPGAHPADEDQDARFLVGLAALSLLARAASEGPDGSGGGPVLCLVDDAQWLDGASAGALGFAARRVEAARVAMVVAVEDGTEPDSDPDREAVASPWDAAVPVPERPPGAPFGPPPFPRLPRTMRVEGLDAAAAAALLAGRRDDLDEAARERLLAQAAGNPLALRYLRPEGGTERLTRRLLAAFTERVRALPPGTREALLLTAAEGTGDQAVVRAVGAPPADPEAAGGLLTPAGSFRHPLAAAAVLHHAPPRERRAAHRALAAALDRPADADRRAWHLAYATPGQDEAVAAELERAAVRARRRGAWEAAARAYEEAARLTPDPGGRARRLTLSGESALSAGLPARASAAAGRAVLERAAAEEVAAAEGPPTRAATRSPAPGRPAVEEAAAEQPTTEQAAPGRPAAERPPLTEQAASSRPTTEQAAAEEAAAAPGPSTGPARARRQPVLAGEAWPRARIARLRAAADLELGRPRRAHALLVEGARWAADPRSRLRMEIGALDAAWAADDTDLLTVTADSLAALRLPHGDRDPLATVRALLLRLAELPLDRRLAPGPYPSLAEVVARAREGGVRSSRALSLIVGAGLVTGHERETRDAAAAMAARCRAHGRFDPLAAMLALRAAADVLLDEHTAARAGGQEALRLAEDTGQETWARYAAGLLGFLAAVEGDEAACRVLVARAGGGAGGGGGGGGGGDAPSEGTTDGGTASGAVGYGGRSPGGTWADRASALLDLGAGRWEAAVTRLDPAAAGPAAFCPPLSRGLPDTVEALVALGRTPDAREVTARVSAWAHRLNLVVSEALLARCRALAAVTGTEAETCFRTALDLHTADPRPFERARTALLYGEWLRRGDRADEARPHLASALAAFTRLSAAPWAARAARALALPRSSAGAAHGN
ncbi:ATP-binding protein [Streptomyces sp. HPF1205]|uniref:ATP-binding protein n=1 Tax=Streptomyces sp. HPF1205 TaxID=2873262 RepID=UPI001CECF7E4|nr:ATP-binding protein [Streptomyces sp. HPF1205]